MRHHPARILCQRSPWHQVSQKNWTYAASSGPTICSCGKQCGNTTSPYFRFRVDRMCQMPPLHRARPTWVKRHLAEVRSGLAEYGSSLSRGVLNRSVLAEEVLNVAQCRSTSWRSTIPAASALALGTRPLWWATWRGRGQRHRTTPNLLCAKGFSVRSLWFF